MSFTSLGLNPALLKAIEESGKELQGKNYKKELQGQPS
jgi:hypothetical protein